MSLFWVSAPSQKCETFGKVKSSSDMQMRRRVTPANTASSFSSCFSQKEVSLFLLILMARLCLTFDIQFFSLSPE